MIQNRIKALAALLALAISSAGGNAQTDDLVQRPWFEARTAHFNLYSCGPTQAVAKVAARLEQFREAYSGLAGAQAVTSPPIIVMAFPDVADMRPFLPLYQDKPLNLAGFFKRGSDENLIVLALSGTGTGSMEVIFHEYTHLLLRHNDRFWPLWLKEGMAEIYSTFDASGHEVRVGKPIEHHLRMLAEKPFLPLAELFAVNNDSPQYNESEHQGIFYAESWLLTHYLFCGDNPARKARFGQLTALLRQGMKPDQAFIQAFQTTLPAMERELRGYLERGRFEPARLVAKSDLSVARPMATRGIPRAETCFRLGNELLRIGRAETAESYFARARKLSPDSPMSYEGLGLLAAERDQRGEAANYFRESLQRGSTSYLTHYLYAREKFQLTADAQDRYVALKPGEAGEIRAEIQKSIALMPDFGAAHQLLGFFELVQGEDLAVAEQQLQRAIQLEPENPSYLLSLAQVQSRKKDPAAARRTLESLRLPGVDAKLRAKAEEMLRGLENP